MVSNFLFHRVSPERDLLWDPMDPKLFDRCIKYISNHFDVLLIEEMMDNKDLLINGKYATISFDDGYLDNIEFAAEILSKYNVKSSFYVVTDCIDNNSVTWTHVIEHLFQNTKKDKIDLDLDFIPEQLKRSKLNNISAKLEYANKIKPYLKEVSHEKRNILLELIQEELDDVELPRLMMSWNDLRELSNFGHYIGSHTVTHAMLGTMTNDDEIRYELEKSGERILAELGYFPKTISYPVGSYSEQVKEISRTVGYEIGLATKQDKYDPKENDDFEIPRIELYNENWFKTQLRISNKLEGFKKLIRYRK